MQEGDILIRRHLDTPRAGKREFFTLDRFPSNETIAGPFPSEQVATREALARAAKEACDAWMQTAGQRTAYVLLTRMYDGLP
jgi:hypothetical protein